MATTTKAAETKTSKTKHAPHSPKRSFLDAAHREHETTKKILRAYPKDKLDIRPHHKSKNARELAHTFVMEQVMTEKVLNGTLDMSNPQRPPVPESLDAIIRDYEVAHKRIVDMVEKMDDDELHETVKFFVAPKTMGDVPKLDFLWMLLHDQIHHRGQFSVYLRMADAKVPSIYGPTADEPWM